MLEVGVCVLCFVVCVLCVSFPVLCVVLCVLVGVVYLCLVVRLCFNMCDSCCMLCVMVSVRMFFVLFDFWSLDVSDCVPVLGGLVGVVCFGYFGAFVFCWCFPVRAVACFGHCIVLVLWHMR